jgi:DNA modification methylase
MVVMPRGDKIAYMFKILTGHVIDKLKELPDKSVHCVATSPPYFGALRDYHGEPQFWSDGWSGCLGDEPDPDQFCSHLVDVFREVKRVLRDDGCFWLNIGDTYAPDNRWAKTHGITRKNLLGIPWMLAFALR